MTNQQETTLSTLTITEFAKILRVSVMTVRRLIHQGKLPPPLPMGRQYRWQVAAIEKWMAEEGQRKTA